MAYHWLFFTAINPGAWLFGAVFLAEAWAVLAPPGRSPADPLAAR